MSGSGSGGSDATTGAGLSSLLDRFKNSPAAAQFSADGSTPSQFTMPGGGNAQYQGTQMMPATLGGAAGVQDAQDWTKAIQQAGGGLDLSALAGLGAGGMQAPDQANNRAPSAPGVHGGGGGGQGGYVPQQLPMGSPSMPQQGNVNLGSPVNATLGPTQSVQNLMQLLKLGNTGFSIK
jgi:hypothetical protein